MEDELKSLVTEYLEKDNMETAYRNFLKNCIARATEEEDYELAAKFKGLLDAWTPAAAAACMKLVEEDREYINSLKK